MKLRAQLNVPFIYTTRECTQRLLSTKYNVIIPTQINFKCKSRVSRRPCFFDKQLCVQTLALKIQMQIQTSIKRITVAKFAFVRTPSRIVFVVDFYYFIIDFQILLMNCHLFTPLFTTFNLKNVSIEWFYSVTPGDHLH